LVISSGYECEAQDQVSLVWWNNVWYSFTATTAETMACSVNLDLFPTRQLSSPYHFFL